jgi:large subunit ribosomal protein L3
MNQYPGVLGRKVGMTQVFHEDGTVTPCTVVAAQSVVVAKRTREADGYDALVVGLDDRKEKHTNKPLSGFYKKQNVAPKRTLREFRCSADYAARFEVGQQLKLDEVFAEGQLVDVKGVSKGRGFSGVVRRHNFAGQTQTHGTHEYERHGGSIGTNMTPGRVLPGIKMPGQHGNKACCVLNQRVVKVLPSDGLILIRGGIPGSRNTLVMVRGAVKRRGGKPAS